MDDQMTNNVQKDENRPTISTEELREFILFIVQKLVSQKDAVEVTVFEDMPGANTVHIKVDQADKGRVIGRSGNTINAIRSIVRVFGRIMVVVEE